jgi:hypothetical protein
VKPCSRVLARVAAGIRDSAERRLGDLAEDRNGRTATQVVERRPLCDTPRAVLVAPPLQLPLPHVLGTSAAARADQIEANRRAGTIGRIAWDAMFVMRNSAV